jgi:hypothetical protein
VIVEPPVNANAHLPCALGCGLFALAMLAKRNMNAAAAIIFFT